MQGSIGVPTEYTQATMPLASAVASGTRVYNSTYGIYLRSNGTRWIATSPFTVDQNVRSDTVTGASAESLMHSINISDAVRYMGPKGRLKVMGRFTVPNTANAKNVRMRLGTTAGTAGSLFFTAALSSTSGGIFEKTLYADNSEASQTSSAAGAVTSGAAGSAVTSTLNFAPGGDTVILSLLSAPVAAGEVVTLTGYSIAIHPGY